MSDCGIHIPDIMYFSSPGDISTGYLSAEINGHVFMSPWIGISSLFIIDRHREVREYFRKALLSRHQKLLSSNYILDYDEWEIQDADILSRPLEEAHLRHNVAAFQNVPPLQSASSGYIYKLDVSGIKEELKLFVTQDADRELVYTGGEKIPIMEKNPHTIRWELSYKENLLQPGEITVRDLDS